MSFVIGPSHKTWIWRTMTTTEGPVLAPGVVGASGCAVKRGACKVQVRNASSPTAVGVNGPL